MCGLSQPAVIDLGVDMAHLSRRYLTPFQKHPKTEAAVPPIDGHSGVSAEFQDDQRQGYRQESIVIITHPETRGRTKGATTRSERNEAAADR